MRRRNKRWPRFKRGHFRIRRAGVTSAAHREHRRPRAALPLADSSQQPLHAASPAGSAEAIRRNPEGSPGDAGSTQQKSPSNGIGRLPCRGGVCSEPLVLAAKHSELLKDLVPTASAIAYLVNRANPGTLSALIAMPLDPI